MSESTIYFKSYFPKKDIIKLILENSIWVTFCCVGSYIFLATANDYGYWPIAIIIFSVNFVTGVAILLCLVFFCC